MTPRQRCWFGHPPGLTILFLTEMWEVFSLYGMRAILALYLTQALGFSVAKASLVFGLYAACTYFTPLIGGVAATRWLGRQRAVLIGSFIMAIGHFMMAVDAWLYPALAVIALGNGLFMPNLASQIDGLYARNDPARAAGFNLYYVGVNLGGFSAPLVCGTLGEAVGWHWGFGAAGIGMLIGLTIFAFGRRYLPGEGAEDHIESKIDEPRFHPPKRQIAFLATILLLVIVYRVGYEQAGNTIALWASEHVDKSVGSSLTIPVSWFQSLNPLFVFLFTPLLLARWKRMAAAGRTVRPLQSMAVGAMTTAAGFFALAGAIWIMGAGSVAWIWLALFFALYTFGEIQILPVGLAIFGRAAPGRLASLAVAIWFSASFFGNLAAGAFGTLYPTLGALRFFAVAAIITATSGLGFVGLHLLGTRVGVEFGGSQVARPINPPTAKRRCREG